MKHDKINFKGLDMLKKLIDEHGFVPSFGELDYADQRTAAAYVITTTGIEAEQRIVESLLKNQVLSMLLESNAIDKQSKWDMLEEAVLSCLHELCDDKITEYNDQFLEEVNQMSSAGHKEGNFL